MESIRPVIELDDAKDLRDLLLKVAVRDLRDSFLSDEEKLVLQTYERKLTELIAMAETRKMIREKYL